MNPRDRIDRLSLWSRNSSQYPQRGSFQWLRYRNPSIILALYSRNFCFGVGRGDANRVIFSPQNMFYPELSINNPIFKRKKWILISCYFSAEYEYRTQAWLIVIGAKRSCIRPYILHSNNHQHLDIKNPCSQKIWKYILFGESWLLISLVPWSVGCRIACIDWRSNNC